MGVSIKPGTRAKTAVVFFQASRNLSSTSSGTTKTFNIVTVIVHSIIEYSIHDIGGGSQVNIGMRTTVLKTDQVSTHAAAALNLISIILDDYLAQEVAEHHRLLM